MTSINLFKLKFSLIRSFLKLSIQQISLTYDRFLNKFVNFYF